MAARARATLLLDAHNDDSRPRHGQVYNMAYLTPSVLRRLLSRSIGQLLAGSRPVLPQCKCASLVYAGRDPNRHCLAALRSCHWLRTRSALWHTRASNNRIIGREH